MYPSIDITGLKPGSSLNFLDLTLIGANGGWPPAPELGHQHRRVALGDVLPLLRRMSSERIGLAQGVLEFPETVGKGNVGRGASSGALVTLMWARLVV